MPTDSGTRWTLDSLYTHIMQRFADAERAVTKAEREYEERFKSVNEFRATLSDQSRDMLPRAEANARFKSLEDKIDLLAKAQDVDSGKSTGFASNWTMLISAVVAMGVLINLILTLRGVKGSP